MQPATTSHYNGWYSVYYNQCLIFCYQYHHASQSLPWFRVLFFLRIQGFWPVSCTLHECLICFIQRNWQIQLIQARLAYMTCHGERETCRRHWIWLDHIFKGVSRRAVTPSGSESPVKAADIENVARTWNKKINIDIRMNHVPNHVSW